MSRTTARLAALATALVATAGGLTACGSDSGSASGDSLKVGVIYLDTQGFYGGVRKGIEDGAKSAGKDVKIVESNAQDDASKESSFMQSLVGQQVDAIMLSASSGTASVPAIKQAHEAGIPVICYNTCIDEPDLSEYVSAYMLGDPIEFGKQLGDAAGDYFVAAGITDPQIGVVNCEFVEVCKKRREGFEEALGAKVPGYEIVENQKGGDASASLSAAQNILTAHPDLDAFMGEYGDATIGAVKAVEAANATGKTVVFGGDMTTDIANALKDNTVLKAQVDISGQVMGKAAIDEAIKVIGGEDPSEVVVPVQVDIYTTPDSAADWLTAHADGIP
jgi:sugar transport system substrate-binding protein